MKALIIGSRGMLGQELARTFSDSELSLWDRAEIDITEKEDTFNKIASLHPEIIINAAAYNNVDAAETDSETADRVNGYAVGYLASVAQEIGAILVHYSTDYIFDGQKKEGYAEDAPQSPISAYARSKALGEQELQRCCTKYYLIRLSRLFGSPGSSQETKESFVDKMLKLSHEKSTLTVIDEELSCPTYASDLARRTREIVDGNNPWGIYHVTNAGGCTWYGFAKEIFAQIGWSGTLIPVPAGTFPRPAQRPRYSMLINTKLPKLQKWQDALRDYLSTKPTL